MMAKYNFTVLPVFSSVIVANKIQEDLSGFAKDVKNLKYIKTDQYDSSKSYSTENFHLMDDHPEVEKLIIEYFYKFKNDVLRLDTTDFEISTSWATKTLTGGSCQFHLHSNCYYSGVMYFDNYEGGNLLFSDIGLNHSSFQVNEPSEYNIYNYKTITIKPEENLIVFFPSHVYHKIDTYLGEKDRHSVAFNFIPVGTVGRGDSSMSIKKIK